MIKRILFSILTFTAALTAVFYLQSCDVKSPIENVKVIFDTEAPKNPASVSFLDARTSGLVTTDIAVTIIGTDKDKIIDFGKNAKTSFTSSGGIVAFAVRDDATFPVNVTVVATVNGYITTSMPVSIAKGGGAYSVYMVNKLNPPDGVSIKETVFGETNAAGIVAQSFSVSTDFIPGSTVGGVGKIRLPAGTIITDVASNPLVGTLRTTIAYFDPTRETALRCFPGGFTTGTNTMVSAGFTSIEITDGSGKSARNFGAQEPEITIEIPAGTNNYAMGRPIQAGDIIPVLSYNPATGANAGTWINEESGTVAPGGNSNFAITFTASHLSYWNLDFLQGPNCTMSRPIKLIQAGGCSNLPLELRMYFVASNGVESYYRTLYVSAADTAFQFYYAPSANMKIKVYYNNTLVQTTGVVSLCSAGDLVINYSIPNLQPITGTVMGICMDNTNIQIRPTLPIYYRPAGTTNWMYLGYMVNGVLTGNCAAFGNYDFMTYYNNQAIFALNVPITTNNISFTYNLPNCVQ